MPQIILGLNSAYHEPAACLLVDGQLVAFAEEERFNRIRHGKKATLHSADQLPEAAIKFCLRRAGVGWKDLTAIGYSLEPEARRRLNLGLPDAGRVTAGEWGTEEGEQAFYASNQRAAAKLRERAPQAAFHFLPHHLCHSASAFLASPYRRAAILIVDGIGELGSTWLGVGDGTEVRELWTIDYPHSLGFVWERFSELLGLDIYTGPGKLMGYGATTDPHGELSGKDHLATLREILHETEHGFVADNDAFRFRTDDLSGLERRFGPRRKTIVDRYEDASIAAALQQVTSDIMVHLATLLYQRVNAGGGEPVTDLCLAGGVALNCVANYEVAARGPFKRLYVQPAANDAGTAYGAAALLQVAGGGQRPLFPHAYLGPDYDDGALRAALDAAGLSYSKPDNVARAVAARIEAGEIVAWFQGRQEVGPRALGNRSIVADPSRFDTRNRINTRVKYRESFRPFAPSVLERAIPRFFSWPAEMHGARYMLFAVPLKERRQLQILPAVIQENGSTAVATARIHLVEPEHNPAYAALIEEFDALTGLPVVLNTSFNIGEPIVTTPEQAISTFSRSAMDALALGPYLAAHPTRR